MAADHKRVWNICTCHQHFCHYNEILLTVADLEHELDQDLEHDLDHDLDQETYVEENPQKYEVVDEETAKKRQRMQQFRSEDKPLLSSEPESDSDSVFVKVNILAPNVGFFSDVNIVFSFSNFACTPGLI